MYFYRHKLPLPLKMSPVGKDMAKTMDQITVMDQIPTTDTDQMPTMASLATATTITTDQATATVLTPLVLSLPAARLQILDTLVRLLS